MSIPIRYPASSTINLFTSPINSTLFGGWDGQIPATIGYAIANQQDIGGGTSTKAYAFSNQTSILNTVITFNGLNIPSDLTNKTMQQLLTENKYLIIVDGT